MAENEELFEIDNERFPTINGDWIISLYQDAAGEA